MTPSPAGAQVVELAPARQDGGVDPGSQPGRRRRVEAIRPPSRSRHSRRQPGPVVEGDAATTDSDDASADAVIGEAMLTMQSDRAKAAIVAEAHRVLRGWHGTRSTNSLQPPTPRRR